MDRISFINDRMPALLPEAAVLEGLNPRHDAVDAMRGVITEVVFVPGGGVQQLSLNEL